MATVALATAGSWLAKTVLGESFKFLGISAAGWGWMAGSLLGSALFGPKIPTQYGPRISDLKAPSGAYGVAIPKAFGTIKIAGKFIWASDIREVKIVKVYKKKFLFGLIKKKYTVVTYEYYADFAVAFCEGPVNSINKIWFDSKLVFDLRNNKVSGWTDSSIQNLKYYIGDEVQEPDPTIESSEGVGNTSPYRGICYAVFTNVHLRKFGNRIPSVSAEVSNINTTIIDDHIFSEIGTDISLSGRPAAWNVSGFQIRTYYRPDPYDYGFIEYRDYLGNLLKRIPAAFSFKTGDPAKPNSSSPTEGSIRSLFQNTDGYALVSMTNSKEIIYAIADIYKQGSKWVFSANGPVYNWPRDSGGTLIGPGIVSIETPIGLLVTTSDSGYTGFGRRLIAINPINKNFAVAIKTLDETIYGYGVAFTGLVYDSDDGFVYANITAPSIAKNYIMKLDDSLNEVAVWEAPYTNIASIIKRGNRILSVSRNSLLYSVIEIDQDGTTKKIHFASTPNYFLSLDPPIVFKDKFIRGTSYVSFDPIINKIPMTVQDIAESLSQEVGLGAQYIDYYSLSSTNVDGYAISRPMTARAAIETLAQAFFFDMVESDGKLKAVPRGSSPYMTISNQDMIPSGEDKTEIETKVVQELELPYKVEVGYIQKDKYLTGLQHASRPDKAKDITNTYSMELAIVMDDDKAAQVAEVILYDLWTAKHRVQFAVPYKYAEIEPGDVINISVNGSIRTVRIVRVGYGPSLIHVEAVYENPNIYSGAKKGGASSGQQIDFLELEAYTEPALMDIPLLSDNDDDPGFYFAASPLGNGSWTGSELYASDDGAAWSSVGFVNTAVPIGYAETVLPDGPTTIWDDKSALTVRIYSGTLTSATDLDVLNGENMMLVGNEIIHFANAVQNANGTYTLSRMLRGRKGTEWATSSHTQYEPVVLLERNAIDRVVYSSTMLGKKRLYRAPSVGQNVLDADQVEFTNTGVGLKPYSPVHVRVKDVGGGNYEVSWVRRTRIDGEWRDLVDVPLGEQSEEYVVEVWRSGSLVSTTNVTTPSATVAAQPGDVIKIAQVSAIVGNGYYASVTI